MTTDQSEISIVIRYMGSSRQNSHYGNEWTICAASIVYLIDFIIDGPTQSSILTVL